MNQRFSICFGLCLSLAAALPLRAFAPHPTVLTAKYKDQMLPVVKVIGTDPVVLVDGKEKRIRTSPVYLPQRAPAYGSGKIEFKAIELAGTQIIHEANDAYAQDTEARVGRHAGLAEFKATLSSATPVRGGFIAVVVYTPLMQLEVDADVAALLAPQVVVHSLPDLPAATEVPVKVSSKMFTYIPGQQYFAQIFDAEGREIPTTLAERAEAYYAMCERLRLNSAVKKYLGDHPGASSAASPVMVIRPLLPEGVEKPTEPCAATLTISPEGVVTAISLSGVDDHRVRTAINEALGGWLFLPKLKNGEPVASRVQVPIEF